MLHHLHQLRSSRETRATVRGSRIPALGGIILFLLATLAASSAQAQIDTYRVLLKNGNTFTSAQRPQVADFDSSKILIRSLGGHIVALDLDQIEKVESDLQFQGFGTLINKTTILVGNVANDAIEPDPNAALDAGGLPPNLSSILINQPFFGGSAAQTAGGGSPFGGGSTSLLEAQVYDLPN